MGLSSSKNKPVVSAVIGGGRSGTVRLMLMGPGSARLPYIHMGGADGLEIDEDFNDSYRKQVVIDGHNVVMDIVQQSAREEHASLQDQLIRESEGYIVTYDAGNKTSLSDARRLCAQIKRVRGDEVWGTVGVILVAIQRERDGSSKSAEELAEQLKSGEELARELQAPHIDATNLSTSNNPRQDVEDIFRAAVKKVWLAQRHQEPQRLK